MGKTDSESQKGIIPRICNLLLEKIQDETHIEISYLEIYKEKVSDLLNTKDIQSTLKVRDKPKIGVYVENLSQHRVSNYKEIENFLNKGNLNRNYLNRKITNTNMNDTSSRSHAIFSLKLINDENDIISKIDLVDLAGSERTETSGTNGNSFKEGISINKSLSAFINVLTSLSKLTSNNDNIKHRESIFTWLLKDSIGGNSKTIFFATISPAHVNYNETLSTLRYANNAKKIKNKVTILLF